MLLLFCFDGSHDKLKRRTDNTMVNRKKTKGQTTIYKTLHRQLKTEQNEPH